MPGVRRHQETTVGTSEQRTTGRQRAGPARVRPAFQWGGQVCAKGLYHSHVSSDPAQEPSSPAAFSGWEFPNKAEVHWTGLPVGLVAWPLLPLCGRFQVRMSRTRMCEHRSFTHPCAFYVIFVECVCVLSCSCHVWLFCNPMDCGLAASSVHGIFQTRILEWVAIASSRGSSRPGIRSASLASPVLAGWFFTTAPPGVRNNCRGRGKRPWSTWDQIQCWFHLILSRHNSPWFFRWGNRTQRSHVTSPRSCRQSVVEQDSSQAHPTPNSCPLGKLRSSPSRPPKTKFEFMRWGGWVRPVRWGKAAQVSLLTTPPSPSFTWRYSNFNHKLFFKLKYTKSNHSFSFIVQWKEAEGTGNK